MKITIKRLAAITIAACAAAGAFALAGCGGSSSNTEEPKSGEAYALTHSDGCYVSKATVTATGSDITAATLVEVYTPIEFEVDEEATTLDGETVEYDGATYYKTVKFGGVTMTCDGENGYTVDGQTMLEYFKTEANVKLYHDAVTSNQVAVVANGADDYTIICNSTANKEENGYWTRTDSSGNSYSRWKVNRDATVNYVITYDEGAFGVLTKSTEGETDSYGVSAKYWYDANSVSTGATWTDMYITDTTRAATGYIQLLQQAYESRV